MESSNSFREAGSLMDSYYGWRARIGVITPPTGIVGTYEFRKVVPEGVAIIETRPNLKSFEALSVQVLDDLVNALDQAVSVLTIAGADCIIQSGTPAVFLKGKSFEQELLERLGKITKVPIVLMASAVIQALKKLAIKKPIVATYYPQNFNALLKKYLEDWRFKPLAVKTLPTLSERPIDFGKIPLGLTFSFAKKLFSDAPEADGIFLSGGGLRTIEIIDPLEKDLGIPVTSSNQASIWRALELLRIHETQEGYGRLLRHIGKS